jgi:hypothetical protein
MQCLNAHLLAIDADGSVAHPGGFLEDLVSLAYITPFVCTRTAHMHHHSSMSMRSTLRHAHFAWRSIILIRRVHYSLLLCTAFATVNASHRRMQASGELFQLLAGAASAARALLERGGSGVEHCHVHHCQRVGFVDLQATEAGQVALASCSIA